MSDLSHDNAKQFWKDFMGGAIYDIIEFIEQTEDWVASEDPKAQASLDALSQHFNQATTNTGFSDQDLIQVCAYVYLSQKLRIMQLIDTLQPGGATQLIQTAENAPKSDKPAAVFLQRNLIFERMRILSRILDPNRIQLVQKIYET